MIPWWNSQKVLCMKCLTEPVLLRVNCTRELEHAELHRGVVTSNVFVHSVWYDAGHLQLYLTILVWFDDWKNKNYLWWSNLNLLSYFCHIWLQFNRELFYFLKTILLPLVSDTAPVFKDIHWIAFTSATLETTSTANTNIHICTCVNRGTVFCPQWRDALCWTFDVHTLEPGSLKGHLNSFVMKLWAQPEAFNSEKRKKKKLHFINFKIKLTLPIPCSSASRRSPQQPVLKSKILISHPVCNSYKTQTVPHTHTHTHQTGWNILWMWKSTATWAVVSIHSSI